MAPFVPPAKYALRLALIGAAYFVTARLSLGLALVHGQVTPIWPPTGIAVVAFLLFGRGVWPAIGLAAFLVNLPIGPTVLGAGLIAVGNTLATLTGAELLRRVGFHLQLDRLRDAAAIIFLAALGGTLISATIGSLVLLEWNAIGAAQLWSTWAVWWTGDAMGILLVAPFLLSLFNFGAPPLLTWRAAFELAALLVATAIVTYVLFLNDLRLEYLVLPLIMAAAWRFRLRGAAPAALVASGVAIVLAVKGLGPFAEETLFEKMVTLQVFNVSLALASFVLASFVDTREREERMARLYAASEASNQAKSRFLHLAAHELRTPITVLSGYLSMLSQGSLGDAPAGWKRPLQVLQEKTVELNRLVGALLEASRIEAKRVPTSPERLDLVDVAREAVYRAGARADLMGARLGFAAKEETLFVAADADQLGRILDNLINNALTYNLNTPDILVSVAAEAGSATLRVTDNGIGVAEAEREPIFEQFHRGNEPQFANVAGTGLGLYISRQLAEANGGHLSLEWSAPGEGSVFRLSLPVAPAAATIIGTAPTRPSGSVPEALAAVEP